MLSSYVNISVLSIRIEFIHVSHRQDARVNNNGDVLLTPIRSTTLCPIYNFPEQESGLKLLVREWVTVSI